jgi:hypothetical protein
MMYVGFRSFLGALVVVGLSLGASFGLGVAFGAKPAPVVAASTTGNATGGAGAGAGAGAAASAGGGAAAGATGGGGAGFGAGGGQAVSGTVESATPTSLVVKSADGTMVTLALTLQTVIRKTDTGTAQDLKAGVQVLATREGASNAATVSIVPAGTTLPGAGGPRGGGGGAPGARGTATP